jgi:hypothetical protein
MTQEYSLLFLGTKQKLLLTELLVARLIALLALKQNKIYSMHGAREVIVFVARDRAYVIFIVSSNIFFPF